MSVCIFTYLWKSWTAVLFHSTFYRLEILSVKVKKLKLKKHFQWKRMVVVTTDKTERQSAVTSGNTKQPFKRPTSSTTTSRLEWPGTERHSLFCAHQENRSHMVGYRCSGVWTKYSSQSGWRSRVPSCFSGESQQCGPLRGYKKRRWKNLNGSMGDILGNCSRVSFPQSYADAALGLGERLEETRFRAKQPPSRWKVTPPEARGTTGGRVSRGQGQAVWAPGSASGSVCQSVKQQRNFIMQLLFDKSFSLITVSVSWGCHCMGHGSSTCAHCLGTDSPDAALWAKLH